MPNLLIFRHSQGLGVAIVRAVMQGDGGVPHDLGRQVAWSVVEGGTPMRWWIRVFSESGWCSALEKLADQLAAGGNGVERIKEPAGIGKPGTEVEGCQILLLPDPR